MNKKTFICAAILCTCFNAAYAECTAPTGTPIIPDGNVASKDELLSAQKAIKSFQSTNLEYLQCIDAEKALLDPEAADIEQKLAEYKVLEDAAIKMEEKAAEEFNTARSAFLAR